MLPTPRREAEVSAGPEAPRGSGVPVVLAPPPPASPVRGDNPPLGSREAEERGARGGGVVASSRCSVRGNSSPDSFGQWRGEGREGEGGGRPLPREERGGGAGCWPEGAGGAGLSPGCGGRKGSHPSRQPGLPSPRPAPRADGRPGSRGPGPWSRWRVHRPNEVSVAWAAGLGLPPALRLRLPASPGAAADILRRAGGGERNCWRGGEVVAAEGAARRLPRLWLRRALLCGLAARRFERARRAWSWFLQSPLFLP